MLKELLQRNDGKNKKNPNYKHGMSATRIYVCWQNMKARCSDTHKKAHLYADKGVTYCRKWETFEGFYEDMGSTYKDGLTLDRIDGSKGYYKQNCRWATPLEQGRNTTSTINVTIGKKTQAIQAWADEYGFNNKSVTKRVGRFGESHQHAVAMLIATKCVEGQLSTIEAIYDDLEARMPEEVPSLPSLHLDAKEGWAICRNHILDIIKEGREAISELKKDI